MRNVKGMSAVKQQASASPPPARLVLSGNGDALALTGALEIATLVDAADLLKRWSKRGASRLLDVGKLDSLDTSGALFLCGLRDKGVELTGVSVERRALLDLVSGLDRSDFFVGLFKAPVFAFFIAIIGCMHGLRVNGSAESVGRETTRAVVKSIFLVIALDAVFSILFETLGV